MNSGAGEIIGENWFSVLQIVESQCRCVHTEILRESHSQRAASREVSIAKLLEFESARTVFFVRHKRACEFFENGWSWCERCCPDMDFAVRKRWVLRRQRPFNYGSRRIQGAQWPVAIQLNFGQTAL